MASGARFGLSYIAEVTRGTTPATPTMKPIRKTSCSLSQDREGFQSETLRDDRAITDYRLGAYKVGGDIGVELAYGEFDDLLEAVIGGTWTANVLKMGTTRRYFTFEELFADWAAGKKYQRYRGCEMDKLTLTFAKSPAMIKGAFSVVGKDLALDTAISAGETYASANTNKPFSSFVGSLTEGGSAQASITELSITLENGLDPQYVLFDPASQSTDIGRSNITGQITARFESEALQEKFLNETESALLVTVIDPDGNSLAIQLPRIKYTGHKHDVTGEGSISQVMPFQALYHTSSASNIVVTRTPDT